MARLQLMVGFSLHNSAILIVLCEPSLYKELCSVSCCSTVFRLRTKARYMVSEWPWPSPQALSVSSSPGGSWFRYPTAECSWRRRSRIWSNNAMFAARLLANSRKSHSGPGQWQTILGRWWERISSDDLNRTDFLIVVDFFSNFWEIDRLTIMSAQVILHLRRQFARYGIPVTFCLDNGPQFALKEFQDFTRSSRGFCS